MTRQYAIDQNSRKTLVALGLDSVVAWDDFDRPDNVDLVASDSGHAWGEWDTANGWTIASGRATPTGTGSSQAYVESGASDGAVAARLKYGGGLIGVIYRGVDASNFLWVDVNGGTSLRLMKREAGSNSSLVIEAVTLATDETYELTVKFVSDKIVATVRDLSGQQIGVATHTLSAGDQTTFGSATLCGLNVFNSPDSRVAAFHVREAL